MHHHLTERRKELKRRRKRKQKRLTEIRKTINATIPIRTIEESVDRQANPLIQTEHQDTSHRPINLRLTGDISNLNWNNVKDIESLISNLPDKVKPQKFWSYMPVSSNGIKEQIIQDATKLKKSREFSAPAEWNGGLKEALILMKERRLPNGFANFLKI